MTGPEHYREAEKLLYNLRNVEHGGPAEPGMLAEAQAHATLALAAAVGLAIRGADAAAWEATAGPKSAPRPPVTGAVTRQM